MNRLEAERDIEARVHKPNLGAAFNRDNFRNRLNAGDLLKTYQEEHLPSWMRADDPDLLTPKEPSSFTPEEQEEARSLFGRIVDKVGAVWDTIKQIKHQKDKAIVVGTALSALLGPACAGHSGAESIKTPPGTTVPQHSGGIGLAPGPRDPDLGVKSTPEQNTDVYEKQRREVGENIKKFFELSRGDFENWAENNPLKANPYGGADWDFPWIFETVEHQRSSGNYLEYPSGKIYHPEPNLSIAYYDKSFGARVVGINLGSTITRMENGDQAVVLWVGTIFPKAFSSAGHDKVVFPVAVDLVTDDPRFHHQGAPYYTTQFSTEPGIKTTDSNIVGNQVRGTSEILTTKKYLKRLKRTQNRLVQFAVTNKEWEDNEKTALTSMIPARYFYKAGEPFEKADVLFSNNQGAVNDFWDSMEDFEKKGQVLLSSNSSFPSWSKKTTNLDKLFDKAVLIGAVLTYQTKGPLS